MNLRDYIGEPDLAGDAELSPEDPALARQLQAYFRAYITTELAPDNPFRKWVEGKPVVLRRDWSGHVPYTCRLTRLVARLHQADSLAMERAMKQEMADEMIQQGLRRFAGLELRMSYSAVPRRGKERELEEWLGARGYSPRPNRRKRSRDRGWFLQSCGEPWPWELIDEEESDISWEVVADHGPCQTPTHA